ncbi:MAG: hypothetical protein KTR31_32145 [Myxococcales bacterium]|nr:hypothetical protein [Myxococcales bacterium]
MARSLALSLLAPLIASCVASQAADRVTESTEMDRPPALAKAPRDTLRLPFPADARQLMRDLDTYHAQTASRRVHVQLDRPLYRPGDEVSVRLWDLATRDHGVGERQLTVQLLDPRGSQVQRQEMAKNGALQLPEGAAGGTWKVVVSGSATAERTFTVNNFQAPRIDKQLTFLRTGYQPGDTVQAVVTLQRATGEILADVDVTTQVRIAGSAQPAQQVRTDAKGEATVRFELPVRLGSPDVNLTVLVDDGGVRESITRAVPVVLDRVELRFFPEGGTLVAGLPGRVYFEAVDVRGEPADVQGTVVDDQGEPVATLRSWVDGRGHVSFVPRAGRTYSARIDRRQGDALVFGLPTADAEGCVMRHHDDLQGTQRAVRLSVRCTESQQVVVLATQQEQIIDRAAFGVRRGRPTTVHLRSGRAGLSRAQGVARVTLMTEELQPMAERLVFRNLSQRMTVDFTPERASYAPGDTVTLGVSTRGPRGEPVAAELSVAVVDDALLSFADDDAHTLTSQVLLQADLPEPIEGVADYFEPGSEDGPLGLDLALGTRGWRTFDWTPVWRIGEQREAERYGWGGVAGGVEGGVVGGVLGGVAMDELQGIGYAEVELAAAAPPPRASAARARPRPVVKRRSNKKRAEAPTRVFAKETVATTSALSKRAKSPQVESLDVRSDFRDTVLWEPVVRTDRRGRATVSFDLSDAVTGFRVSAQGVGNGALGAGSTEIASTLPLSVALRVPQALSAGDELVLPITVENRRERRLTAQLGLEAGELLALGAMPDTVPLEPGERRTVHARLTAQRGRGEVGVRVIASAGSDNDGVQRSIPVVAPGFPQRQTFSGVLDRKAVHTVALQGALPESVSGHVTVFPSVVSELTEGMEGMLRTPGGCFEQTSSTNYPNVVILELLDRSGGGGTLAVDRQQILDAGYGILRGYQVGSGGFETWGSGPGKEALSAYGLMQFSDMSKVFDVDPSIVSNNVRYLYDQRDGKGGYRVTGASAHGYGTAPTEVLDAYITYALVETGHRDLDTEIEAQAEMAQRSEDPYRLSMATMTLLATKPAAGRAAAKRLAALQADDGSFPGSETSITRSENQNLLVEATALSAMALHRAGNMAAANHAVEWIHGKQTAAGQWGATQGNALALKAIAQIASGQGASGHVVVRVDGEVVGRGSYAADDSDPLTIPLEGLTPEAREVELSIDGSTVPYAVQLDWTTEEPTEAADRRLDVSTELSEQAVAMGQTTRLRATVTNRTSAVVPDPIARIGLPAGLEAEIWQLEELQDKGVIAFFETRPREVTLYWDGIHPRETHEVALDLVARVPGSFTGPASSAYPYYDDEAKGWAEGLAATVRP